VVAGFRLGKKKKAQRRDDRGAYARPTGSTESSASFGFGKELEGHQGPRSYRGGSGGGWGGQIGAPSGQRGGFSLRGRPDVDEADEAARRDLLAVGVMRADGIVAFRPEGGSPTQPSTG
jgi:hypothetical protein